MMNPEAYIASSWQQYRDTRDIINEFSHELSSMNGKAIDIGCGPGNATEELLLVALPHIASLVGTDVSLSMIEYAKKHHKNEKLSFMQLDIMIPELPKNLIGQFNSAFSFYCLHWCRDLNRALGNIYKLLSPGGKALTIFISHHDMFSVYEKHMKDPRYSSYTQDAEKYVSPLHSYSNADEVMKIKLEKSGFNVLHCSERWFTFSHEAFENLFDLIIAINPFVSRMPPNLQEEYRNDIAQELRNIAEKYSQFNDGCFNDRYSLIIAYFGKPTED